VRTVADAMTVPRFYLSLILLLLASPAGAGPMVGIPVNYVIADPIVDDALKKLDAWSAAHPREPEQWMRAHAKERERAVIETRSYIRWIDTSEGRLIYVFPVLAEKAGPGCFEVGWERPGDVQIEHVRVVLCM
jgi:hypothetical protein